MRDMRDECSQDTDCLQNSEEEKFDFEWRVYKEEPTYSKIASQGFLFITIFLVLVTLAIVAARIRDGPEEVKRAGSPTVSINLQTGETHDQARDQSHRNAVYAAGAINRRGVYNLPTDSKCREIHHHIGVGCYS